jgi:hypothetical protein
MGFDPRTRASLVVDWCWRVGFQGDADRLDALLRHAYERSGLAPGYRAFSSDGLPAELELLESTWVGTVMRRPVAHFRARFGGLAGAYWQGRFSLDRGYVDGYPDDEPFRDALIRAQGHDPRSLMRIDGATNRLAAIFAAAFDRSAAPYESIEVS